MSAEVRNETAASSRAASALPTMKSRLDPFAISLLTIMCIFLAVGQVAIKIANAGISPILQAGLRSLASAALLGLFSVFRGVPFLLPKGVFGPALLTSFFFAAEFALLYPGLERTTAAHAVILLYTSPLVVAVGSHYLIPGDPLTRTKVIGLILALAGVAIVVLGKDTGTSGQAATLTGDLLCLGGAFAWGFLTLAIRATRLAQVSPERVTFAQLAMSGPMLCALSWIVGEAGLTNPSPLHWSAFGFTVVFVGFAAFTMTNWLYMRYPASRVIAFLMLTPVFGVVAAHILLGEPIGLTLVAGLILVVAGLWQVNRRPA